MATKIVTKNSSTASAVPTTSDLVQGELAVNVADKRLFTEDNGGNIVELGTNPTTLIVDTTTLVVDSTNNRVGIGTASPSQALTVDGTDARIYLTGANTDIDMDASANGQLHLDGNAYGFGIALNASGANLYTNSGSRDLIFGVNETEVMRVTNSNVGIGTSAPEYNLDVTAADNVTTTTAISVQNSSRNYGLGLGAYTLTNRNIGGSAATVDYTFDIGGDALFKTSNAERFRIDQSGNIGLRSTSNVVSSTSGSGAWVSNGNYVAIAREGTSTAHPALYLNQTGVTGQVLQFRKDGTSVGSISTNGSSLPSDRNFKRNIESLDLGLDFVASLNPVTYNYKLDEEGQPVMTGLIAQEVEESLTAAGVEKNSMTLLQHTPTDDVKESDYQMDYLKLVPILINSIKEQQTLIESLTDRIAALEA